MKITFEQTKQTTYTNSQADMIRTTKTQSAKTSAVYKADAKDRAGIVPFTEDSKKTAQDIMEMASNTDVQTTQDKMTLLSNTMSEEDYARLSEEGYDISKMDPAEAVTILDTIKAELIKAGKNIVGYTDDISMEALAGAVGSEGLARQLAEAFAQADIPASNENIQKAVGALEAAKGLTEPTAEAVAVMIEKGLAPTIRGFLLAKTAAVPNAMMSQGAYFGEEIKGYVTKNVTGDSSKTQELESQLARIVESFNEKAVTDVVSMEEAQQLLSLGVPVNEISLKAYTDIKKVTFPLDMPSVLKSITTALADGEDAYDANLAEDKTLVEKAFELYEFYQGEKGAERIKDRRILEEIRLSMTVEVNRKLLESGFSIDTAPMEELVDALKQAESIVAKTYFKDSATATEDYQLLQRSVSVIREIPSLPAQTVPMFMEQIEKVSVEQIHKSGAELAQAFKEANTAYETIGTAPRADLGDRIGKAFVSVDALLHDLSYPVTPENQKAVRALAYHEMEITAHNIEQVKQAEEKLLTVVHKMTPGNVLQMIRDGVNPLAASLDELNTYLQEAESSYENESAGYAEFLHQLDKTGGITQDEREGFIGIYRMLRQIDKADGAAVSGIVNTGAQLNFATLLSAVRSGKYKGMDVKVTDEIGALAENISFEDSISDQIQRAYESSRKDLADAAKANAETYTLLEKGQMPQTVENVVAANGLLEEPKTVLQKISTHSGKKRTLPGLPEKESDFADDYDAELIAAKEAVMQDTFASESEIDVRAHQLLNKQISILTGLSQSKEYYFEAQMNEETALVHLRFEEGDGEALAEILVESEKIGTLQGYLQVDGEELTGYFVGNKKDMVRNLQDHADIKVSTDGKEWNLRRIEFVYSETGKASLSTTRKSENERVSTGQLYQIAAGFLDAVAHVGDMIS